MAGFILKKEKRKGYPSLFVGEGSRERPASCSFLEGSSLVLLKPHLPDSLPKYHRAAERFQSKDQSHFLAQYQSVTNLTHAEAPFNEIPIVNAVLSPVGDQIHLGRVQFKKATEAQTSPAHSGHSSSK